MNPSSVSPSRGAAEVEPATRPTALQVRAAEHLRFIRDAMACASAFTSVPGQGGMAIGVIALVAVGLSATPTLGPYWLAIWISAAAVSMVVGGWAMWRKAERQGATLSRGVGQRFLLTLCPPIVAGAILTPALISVEAESAIPGMWLLLYGTGVIAGGAFSIALIRTVGFCFMVLGVITLLAPTSWANLLLGVGFGGFHLVTGWLIAKHHGG